MKLPIHSSGNGASEGFEVFGRKYLPGIDACPSWLLSHWAKTVLMNEEKLMKTQWGSAVVFEICHKAGLLDFFDTVDFLVYYGRYYRCSVVCSDDAGDGFYQPASDPHKFGRITLALKDARPDPLHHIWEMLRLLGHHRVEKKRKFSLIDRELMAWHHARAIWRDCPQLWWHADSLLCFQAYCVGYVNDLMAGNAGNDRIE